MRETKVGDFYIGVISKFLEEERTKDIFWAKSTERFFVSTTTKMDYTMEELVVLRKLFKTNIMTQFYGISFVTFHKNFKKTYNKKKI